MPFGIKKPYSFVRPGYVTGSYDGHCQGCGVEKAGVAPVKFPLADVGIHESQTYLVCANCYGIQNRLNYPTIEDFKNRSSRSKGTARVRAKPVAAPTCIIDDSNDKNVLAMLDVIRVILNSQLISDVSVIKAKLDELSNSLAGGPAPAIVEPVILTSITHDLESLGFAGDDPDFDIDFGMTPEQRKAMDEAFNRRASRSV